MPKRKETPTKHKRDRFDELETHVAQIDTALPGDTTASEVSSLLRERRMTLNAIDAMVILVTDTPADEMKAKRQARREKLG
jgi:hypothetical protein